jgi:hypothetical protein
MVSLKASQHLISRKATVPGRKRCGFLTPPLLSLADLRAARSASAFRGALPPVDLRAVCLVRAIMLFLWFGWESDAFY